MSLEEGAMAAQGMNAHHGDASPSSPQGNSFVKSIDRKARSYLKSLERSFSFSTTESKGEDPSTMTIEFLRARLQAQRAEYKAEKQRSQQLVKKVLELEQRLCSEIERRRIAECNNMQLMSPNYCHGPPTHLKDTLSYGESGLDSPNSKLKDSSSGDLDCCSEISGSEGHPDGEGVFLVSPSSLRHHWESLRFEHQQGANQHVLSQFNDGINAASVLEKEPLTLSHKEPRDMLCEARSCDEYALSMEVLQGIADREGTKLHAITTDFKQELTVEAWNTSFSSDPQSSSGVSNGFDTPVLEYEKPSEGGYNVLDGNPHRQATTIYNADKSFKSANSYRHATKATTHHPNYLARPIDGCLSRNQLTSTFNKMISPNLSTQSGVLMQDFHASLEADAKRPNFGTLRSSTLPPLSKSMSANHERVLEYIAAHSDAIKEMQEERANSLRHVSNQESKCTYVREREISAPECINDYEMSTLRRHSSEKLRMPKTNATFNTRRSFSAVQTRRGRKLHGHRMSLDGGLDRLQQVGKELAGLPKMVRQ